MLTASLYIRTACILNAAAVSKRNTSALLILSIASGKALKPRYEVERPTKGKPLIKCRRNVSPILGHCVTFKFTRRVQVLVKTRIPVVEL